MTKCIGELHFEGNRLRYPWWQLESGEYFDVVTSNRFDAEALRNTISASAGQHAKKYGKKFRMRWIEDNRIRVWRIDGMARSEASDLGKVLRGDDPLEVVTLSPHGLPRVMTAASEAELDALLAAAQRGASWVVNDLKIPRRYEISADRAELKLTVKASVIDGVDPL